MSLFLILFIIYLIGYIFPTLFMLISANIILSKGDDRDEALETILNPIALISYAIWPFFIIISKYFRRIFFKGFESLFVIIIPFTYKYIKSYYFEYLLKFAQYTNNKWGVIGTRIALLIIVYVAKHNKR